MRRFSDLFDPGDLSEWLARRKGKPPVKGLIYLVIIGLLFFSLAVVSALSPNSRVRLVTAVLLASSILFWMVQAFISLARTSRQYDEAMLEWERSIDDLEQTFERQIPFSDQLDPTYRKMLELMAEGRELRAERLELMETLDLQLSEQRAMMQTYIEESETVIELQRARMAALETQHKRRRGPKVGTYDRVREAHRLAKGGMPLTKACKQAHTDTRTYYQYCERVTGDEPIIPYENT